MAAPNRFPLALRIVHVVPLALFAGNIFCCAYLVFVVIAPEGRVGPPWGAASGLPKAAASWRPASSLFPPACLPEPSTK